MMATIWKELKINDFPVDAEAIDPSKDQPSVPFKYDEAYKIAQCERGVYQFTWTKCSDRRCCKQFRSPLEQLLPGRFLPAPRIFIHEGERLRLADPKALPRTWHYTDLNEALALPVKQKIPLDMYNPKVMLELSHLKCPICGVFLESRTSIGRHRRALHPRQRADDPPLPTSLEILNFSLESAQGIVDQREA